MLEQLKEHIGETFVSLMSTVLSEPKLLNERVHIQYCALGRKFGEMTLNHFQDILLKDEYYAIKEFTVTDVKYFSGYFYVVTLIEEIEEPQRVLDIADTLFIENDEDEKELDNNDYFDLGI